jgi:16S rRNA (uracil1498-N3)-methyltransferase
MRLHRFIGNFDLSKEKIEIKNSENIKQIKNVLRLKKGDFLILCDGKGQEEKVAILEMLENKIVCEKIEKILTPELERKVNLYLAILKKENFELAVQKAVEVGASKIIPIITERTVKTGLNIERLKKIILEASEQCGRGIMPTLSPILDFKDALKASEKNDEKIIFHVVSDSENNLYTPSTISSISIFIGPEGGFTEKEIELAKESGYTVASLGNLTLRGETAAIVATYRAVNGI